MSETGYSALSQGGTTLASVASMGESAATLVVGASLNGAADLLAARTAVPDFRFAGLMGLEACDAFTMALANIARRSVPARGSTCRSSTSS